MTSNVNLANNQAGKMSNVPRIPPPIPHHKTKTVPNREPENTAQKASGKASQGKTSATSILDRSDRSSGRARGSIIGDVLKPFTRDERVANAIKTSTEKLRTVKGNVGLIAFSLAFIALDYATDDAKKNKLLQGDAREVYNIIATVIRYTIAGGAGIVAGAGAGAIASPTMVGAPVIGIGAGLLTYTTVDTALEIIQDDVYRSIFSVLDQQDFEKDKKAHLEKIARLACKSIVEKDIFMSIDPKLTGAEKTMKGKEIKPGDPPKEEIKLLQYILKLRGLYKGPQNGVLDKETIAASGKYFNKDIFRVTSATFTEARNVLKSEISHLDQEIINVSNKFNERYYIKFKKTDTGYEIEKKEPKTNDAKTPEYYEKLGQEHMKLFSESLTYRQTYNDMLLKLVDAEKMMNGKIIKPHNLPRKEIKALQELLSALNLFSGKPNGILDKKTLDSLSQIFGKEKEITHVTAATFKELRYKMLSDLSDLERKEKALRDAVDQKKYIKFKKTDKGYELE